MPYANGNGQVYPDNGPLLRWGGLYVFKSGKGFAGNINLGRVDQETGRNFGEVLLDQIQDCIDSGSPLRIVVFENNFADAKSSHTIHSTKGVSRAQMQQQQQSPDTNQPEQLSGEPVPRPIRRGAPRR